MLERLHGPAAALCNPLMKEGSVVQAASADYNDLLN